MDITICRGLMERNPVFGLANDTEVFVIDGRVYYCSDTGPDTSSWYKSKRVKEGPLIEILEKMGDEKMEQLYTNYQKKVITQELGSVAEKSSFMANRDYSFLVKFVFSDIFPYLRKGNNEDNDRAIKGRKREENEAEMFEREVDEYVRNKINEMASLKPRERSQASANKLDMILLSSEVSRSKETNSVFLKVMGGVNFAMVGGMVYTLSNVRRQEDLTVNGNKYILLPSVPLKELAEDVTLEITKKLSVDALRERLKDSEEFKKLKSERSDIEELCRKERYHEGDFGFEKVKGRNDAVLIYVEVPDYVLENPSTGCLYKFDSHRIGMKVSGYDGEIRLIENPMPIGTTDGPFYYERGAICMGEYGMGYFSSMPKGKAFAKYLTDARNVVLHGYLGKATPVKGLRDEFFGRRRITPEGMKRLGLTVSNLIMQPRTRRSEDE